jgi:hypothetical protein
MTALIARQNIDGSKPDTANGVSVANFELGTGNAWDCIQTLGVGVGFVTSGTAALTQANAGLLLIDASAGNVILNMPAASAAVGAVFQFKRVDASTNTVTINRAGSDTIDGALLLSLVAQYEFDEIRSDGVSAWRRLNTFANPARARNVISANDSIFRNRVINGNCFEDQRNQAAAQSIVAAAALAYCIDRFYTYCTGANVTGQQVTAADGTKRYRFTGAASVTAIGFGHRFEAANTVDLAGGTATLSVKLANSLLTTVNWAIYYANSADSFGTLASPTRTSITSGSFTVSASEGVYSAQIAVPAAATTGLELVLSVGAQVSGTLSIGEIQLEKGAVVPAAISFERVDVTTNKARCQRYLPALNSVSTTSFIGIGGAVSAAAAYCHIKFPVTARVAPTGVAGASVTTPSQVQISGIASTTSSAVAISVPSVDGCNLSLTTAGQTPGVGAIFFNTASGQLLFTGCEL